MTLSERLDRCADAWERDASIYLGRRRAWRVERALGLRALAGRPYVTKTGRALTDADFQALADEAERGYDVDHLR